MYVYILRSIKNKKHYVGITNDISRRFLEHNSGWVSKTKCYKPFELIHVELAQDIKQARKIEKYFKSGCGREIIKEIEKNLLA